MRNEFDLAGYSADQQLVLIVEVKFSKEISQESAAVFRTNLIAHGFLSRQPGFLLVYRTTLFLWQGNAEADAPPHFTASMKPIVRKYLGPSNPDDEAIGPETLEYAVNAWLMDAVDARQISGSESEADQALVDSGLLALLEGGAIRRQLPT